MLSQMAIDDMDELREQGACLTPEDIIRLNELGLRVERGGTASDVIACPRIGWAGDTPIHEPTLASESWCDSYAQRWYADDPDNFAACVLFACAHAVDRGFFQRPEMRDRDSVTREIRAWREALPVTGDQLKVALEYALLGCHPGADIHPAPAKPDGRKPCADSATASMEAEVIAAGLGLSRDDIGTLTSSAVYALIVRYHRNHGCSGKEAKMAAVADYVRTLSEIKKARS